MSAANSLTRRAEPRTAKDLAARGYKLLTIASYERRGLYESLREFSARCPREYKLVAVGSDDRRGSYSPGARWAARIVAHDGGTRSEAHLPLKGSSYGTAKKPMAGGPFESVVAAAHAALDAQGI